MVLLAVLWPDYASCSISQVVQHFYPSQPVTSIAPSMAPARCFFSRVRTCIHAHATPLYLQHRPTPQQCGSPPSRRASVNRHLDVYPFRRSRSAASIAAFMFIVESPVSADLSACLGQLRPWCVRRPHLGGMRAIFKDGICAPCLKYGECPSTLPQGMREAETKVLSPRLLHHTRERHGYELAQEVCARRPIAEWLSGGVVTALREDEMSADDLQAC